MSVGLIYSQSTGRLRRIVNPAPNSSALSAGEGLLVISDAQYIATSTLSGLQSLVNVVTSKVPTGDRYVSVDASRNVLSAHIADPSCGDAAPNPLTTLTPHATAKIGDLLWGGKVLPKQQQTNHALSAVIGRTRRVRNEPLP